MVVGTIRDITAERYAVQRETALSASTTTGRAARTAEALPGGGRRAAPLWQATAVFADWHGTVTAADVTPVTDWAQPRGGPDTVTALRIATSPRITIDPAAGAWPTGAGTLSTRRRVRRDLARTRPGARVRHRGPDAAAAPVRSHSGRRCTGRTPPTSNARSPSRCNGPSSARPQLPNGFAVRYEPASRPWRSAATGTTRSTCPTAGSASSSVTAWAGVCPPPR